MKPKLSYPWIRTLEDFREALRQEHVKKAKSQLDSHSKKLKEVGIGAWEMVRQDYEKMDRMREEKRRKNAIKHQLSKLDPIKANFFETLFELEEFRMMKWDDMVTIVKVSSYKELNQYLIDNGMEPIEMTTDGKATSTSKKQEEQLSAEEVAMKAKVEAASKKAETGLSTILGSLKNDLGLGQEDALKALTELLAQHEKKLLDDQRNKVIKDVRELCVKYRITATNLKGCLATRAKGSGFAKLDQASAKAKKYMAEGKIELAKTHIAEVEKLKAQIAAGEIKPDEKKPRQAKSKKQEASVVADRASISNGSMKLDIPTMGQAVVK
jgi:hypothetical protein